MPKLKCGLTSFSSLLIGIATPTPTPADLSASVARFQFPSYRDRNSYFEKPKIEIISKSFQFPSYRDRNSYKTIQSIAAVVLKFQFPSYRDRNSYICKVCGKENPHVVSVPFLSGSQLLRFCTFPRIVRENVFQFPSYRDRNSYRTILEKINDLAEFQFPSYRDRNSYGIYPPPYHYLY